jgi:hypothetical protein
MLEEPARLITRHRSRQKKCFNCSALTAAFSFAPERATDNASIHTEFCINL